MAAQASWSPLARRHGHRDSRVSRNQKTWQCPNSINTPGTPAGNRPPFTHTKLLLTATISTAWRTAAPTSSSPTLPQCVLSDYPRTPAPSHSASSSPMPPQQRALTAPTSVLSSAKSPSSIQPLTPYCLFRPSRHVDMKSASLRILPLESTTNLANSYSRAPRIRAHVCSIWTSLPSFVLPLTRGRTSNARPPR